ncbi:tetratricopeptide (TPR) repeat protein [Chryseobacterium ginsenosidimutans]|uniref:soluble NSF attachment family protein n=1 Tax=Chryseobacterium ginsenosidimutans TaxID=687846 RepID=UPI00216794F1|nr:soluble NSF attachment family protein [Chryseobacterium ginsenosidimutans]MCS3868344.1 tetratricopeptide (TPR) repeat protein [Chryseobacterium ginsenosidimutans]
MNRQKFIDKFMAAFFILVIIKVIGILAQLFHQSFWSVLGTLAIFAIVAFIIFMVLLRLEDKEKTGNSSGRKGSGGSSYIETSLFDRIRNKYEDLAQKYLDEKDYKKAAKVYMNLLRDNYRGAKTLEEGGFYNEAAVIYLKKLKNKSEAANCYEKAKQYRKAIDLYKELEQKEKVGDLYRQINDAKNANTYYQMVVDDYVSNNQMVKGSLIYRKKMEMPEEAQKILLKGWEEDRDSFNCLNNYFANIFDVKKLDQQIQELYEKTPSDKKITYLEAIKYEFKKDPKLQNTTRNIAYEIIAEKVATRSEIVNELKYFNPDDEVILKDISRYKTGRNRMFRN